MSYNTQLGFDSINSTSDKTTGWNLPYPPPSSVPPYNHSLPYPAYPTSQPPYPPQPGYAQTPSPYPANPPQPGYAQTPSPYPANPPGYNPSYNKDPYKNNASSGHSAPPSGQNLPYSLNPYLPPDAQGKGSIEVQHKPQLYSHKPVTNSTSMPVNYPSLEPFPNQNSNINEYRGSSLRDCNRNKSLQTSQCEEAALPPNSILLYESHFPVNIFFIQDDGGVVSPVGQPTLRLHKIPAAASVETVDRSSKPSLSGNLQGASHVLVVGSLWKLGIKKERDFSVKGIHNELAILDRSTTPERSVIIHFSKGKKEDFEHLDIMLGSATQMAVEPATSLDSLETGVESAYNSATDSMNSFVRRHTPSLYGNTKWLRKGTGSVFRFSGNAMSKGAHKVSDPFLDKETKQVIFPEHAKLFSSLEKVRNGIQSEEVTHFNTVNS